MLLALYSIKLNFLCIFKFEPPSPPHTLPQPPGSGFCAVIGIMIRRADRLCKDRIIF